MARTGKPLLNWKQLRIGQAVTFYTADGWKKGSVTGLSDHHCSINWSSGSTIKTTNCYDTRNIRIAE
jgi:hypothetical protein